MRPAVLWIWWCVYLCSCAVDMWKWWDVCTFVLVPWICMWIWWCVCVCVPLFLLLVVASLAPPLAMPSSHVTRSLITAPAPSCDATRDRHGATAQSGINIHRCMSRDVRPKRPWPCVTMTPLRRNTHPRTNMPFRKSPSTRDSVRCLS
jgi:hypothetical protein